MKPIRGDMCKYSLSISDGDTDTHSHTFTHSFGLCYGHRVYVSLMCCCSMLIQCFAYFGMANGNCPALKLVDYKSSSSATRARPFATALLCMFFHDVDGNLTKFLHNSSLHIHSYNCILPSSSHHRSPQC